MRMQRLVRWLALAALAASVGCGGPPGTGDLTPAAPTNVTVVAGAGFVDVSWAHDGANVTGFAIYREAVTTTATSSGAPLAEVGASARTYRDDTVEPGVPYRYAVAAKGAGGSASSPTTQDGDPAVPDEPPPIEATMLWEAFAARGDVRSLAFSPDGGRLATGVLEMTAHVWDVASGEELLVIRAGSTVSTLDFGPDGDLLATGGSRVQIWDAHDGERLLSIALDDDELPDRDWARALAFSPDGRTVAAGSDNGLLRTWSVATGELLLRIDLNALTGSAWRDGASRPEYDPRQRVLVASDTADATGGPPAHEPVLPASRPNRVTGVAFSPDGGLLASIGYDGAIRLWDAATGELELHIAAFGGVASAVSFSPDGATIAASGFDGLASVVVATWDTVTGALVRDVADPGGPSIADLAYAPDGSRLAGAARDGRLFVWDLVGDEAPAIVAAHRARAAAVAYAPAGGLIATGGGEKDGTAALWDAATLDRTASFVHGGWIDDVDISPDGSQVASAASDGTVTVWDALSGAQRFVDEDRSWSRSLAFSPDASRLAFGYFDGVDVLDSLTGDRLLALPTANFVFSLDFDAAGGRIAAGAHHGSMFVWDAATGAELHAIAAFPGGQVESMAFTPDGSEVVSGVGYAGSPASFAVWDAASGEELVRRDANDVGVFALAFTDGGARMLSAGRSPILVWDTTTWEVTDTIDHAGTISALAVTDEFLVVGGWGANPVSFLEPTTGEVLASLPDGSARLGYHADSGRLVVTQGAYVQVWEVSTR